jgi:U3 small nucleolar RNA-associated protein 12
LRLDGHHGEIWALAVAKFGNFVVTGSHDRSIRVWKKTDEQVYLDEEREKEIEDMLDKATIRDNENLNLPIGALAESEGDVKHRKLQSQGDLKSGEKIVEALEIWLEDKVRTNIYVTILGNDWHWSKTCSYCSAWRSKTTWRILCTESG